VRPSHKQLGFMAVGTWHAPQRRQPGNDRGEGPGQVVVVKGNNAVHTRPPRAAESRGGAVRGGGVHTQVARCGKETAHPPPTRRATHLGAVRPTQVAGKEPLKPRLFKTSDLPRVSAKYSANDELNRCGAASQTCRKQTERPQPRPWTAQAATSPRKKTPMTHSTTVLLTSQLTPSHSCSHGSELAFA
jgi:hypothetical protein